MFIWKQEKIKKKSRRKSKMNSNLRSKFKILEILRNPQAISLKR